MNVAVCIKHAVDEAELKADASGKPMLQGSQSKMSVFDRNAVEEAVRIKELKGGSVLVINVGNQEARRSVKEALAMGCDRAIMVSWSKPSDALATSYLLSRAVRKAANLDLVICSEGASDTYDGLVGPMLAEWLGYPFMGYARKIQVEDGLVRCESALEESMEVLEAALPSVISVVSEVNSPRYPTLLQIMQASKKPIEEITAESLSGEDHPTNEVDVLDTMVQSVNRKRVIFEDPPEEAAKKLVDALRKEGVL